MSEISESEIHDIVSMELDFGFEFLPKASGGLDPHSQFTKSVGFSLTIRDKKRFKRCVYVSISALVFVLVLVPLSHFRADEKETNIGASMNNLTIALNQALLFFDAQKRLDDADLVEGFYDSSWNNFSTAYAVTLLSWTVIEYRRKYAEIGELDHIKDIIEYGSDYLLKLFTTPSSNSDSAQVRLAGEIVVGLSAASLVFSGDRLYSKKLVRAAEKLFVLVSRQDPSHKSEMNTENDACGDQESVFCNSSAGYVDELVWAGTWFFFATGNTTYLKYATDKFVAAEEEYTSSEKGIFCWNNKLTSSAILLTRIRYFTDLGYPYEDALSTNRSDLLMCAYLSPDYHTLSVENGATAAFISKLYADYLRLLGRTIITCTTGVFSVEVLRDFAMSQVNYILGDHYPNHFHYRNEPWFAEPSISSIAGLVAALIAVHDRPIGYVDRSRYGGNSGIDQTGMFQNVHLI